MPYKQWEYPPPVEGDHCVGQGQGSENILLRVGIAVELHLLASVARRKFMSATTRILVLCLLDHFTAGLTFTAKAERTEPSLAPSPTIPAQSCERWCRRHQCRTNVTKHVQTTFLR